MVDRIGSLLTPVLLITIVAMIIKGFVDFGGNPSSPGSEAYTSNFAGFGQGFTNGYLTMELSQRLPFL